MRWSWGVRLGALISSLDKNVASTPKVSAVINTENLLLWISSTLVVVIMSGHFVATVYLQPFRFCLMCEVYAGYHKSCISLPTMAFLKSPDPLHLLGILWACSFTSSNSIPWMIWKLQFMIVVAVDTVGQQPLSFLHNAYGWVIRSISLSPTQLSATLISISEGNGLHSLR